MLQLTDIVKDYGAGESVVHALKSVNLSFRKSEFVSVLGQSGCGKTTLLNIIGGLDRYTFGDMRIDGISTKDFADVDWDAYRNLKVGFIFQSYNLISHIDILSNVEMALTLSGVSGEERKKRAKKALDDVGLAGMYKKMPNQLSGGQMQRVSIARALINNPEIVLADEPTGALDTATSEQIMELLEEISKDRLIIMVTHNPELAERYSSRIIRLSDGEVVSDSNPYEEPAETVAEAPSEGIVADKKAAKKARKAVEKEKKKALAKTSMSYATAIKLSFKNLMTKKGRTIMTAIAGSIGIIGVALVLAISNGLNGYIADLQHDVLAGYPIEIARESMDTNKIMSMMMGGGTTERPTKYPEGDDIFPYDPSKNFMDMITTNNITEEYVDYIRAADPAWIDSIKYSYAIDMNVINKTYAYKDSDAGYYKVTGSPSTLSSIMDMVGSGSEKPEIGWQQLSGDESYIRSQYDLIAGKYPREKNEVVLVVDKSNQVHESMLAALGLNYRKKVKFSDIIGENGQGGVKLVLATNDAMYAFDAEAGYYKTNDLRKLYEEGGEGVIELKVTGILREREDAKLTTLSTGIAYLDALTQFMLADGIASDIVKAQSANADVNLLTGKPFSSLNPLVTQRSVLEGLGGTELPTGIHIFPKDFDAKEKVLTYLNDWNAGKASADVITYNDMSKFATDMMSETINIITIALICFAAVSLLVSSVMIGIITYVSVVERTKEIGILRSLGARKRDITNVFNAETALIGFSAGVIGVIVTYLLHIPINLIIYSKIQIATLCLLSPWHALILIAVSMGLTIFAGLMPAFMASKRDPVVALRTE